MRRLMIAASVAALLGCTDAERAKLGALGDHGLITCYSGGKPIYEGRATGKIAPDVAAGGGWFFKDAATGELIRVSGDCVIRN